MLDRLGQPVEVGDYIWYNTKTRSSYLQLGRIAAITRKPETNISWSPNEVQVLFKIKVQWEGDSPSLLEEWVYCQRHVEPIVQSNRFLKATPEQVGREIVRRTAATR